MNFNTILKNSSKQVNKVLRNYLLNIGHQKTLLLQAMRYSLLSGGKRLRSCLIYQIGQMFELETTYLDDVAAAIECIHSYSLIHDDLPSIDNSKLRRGKIACHIKFNESIAILAGDALQALAFYIMSNINMPLIKKENKLEMIAALALASGANGMCLGQYLDIKDHQNKSIRYLNNMCNYKTGALIRAAVRIASLAAGKKNDHHILCYLDHYAASIGLAFQIKDDILDILGNSKVTGKPSGIDKKLYKSTYPSLIGLNSAKIKVDKLYFKALTSLKHIAALGYNVNTLISLAQYVIQRNK